MDRDGFQPTESKPKSGLLDRLSRSGRLSPIPVPEGKPYFAGRTAFILLLLLAIIGTFATGFLTYRHVLLTAQVATVGDSPLCRADGNINCDAILLTEYATITTHVSSAALGLTGFVFVLWCAICALFIQGIRKLATAVLVLYFFAAIGFSWYFVYLMAFRVHFVCTWCIVTHVVNLFCIIIMLALAISKRREFLLVEISSRAERTLFVLGGVLASLLVFFSVGMWERALSFNEVKENYETLANDPVVVMAILRGSPTYDIPVSTNDPVYGLADARFPVVFFSDFQCPVCQKEQAFLKKMVDSNPKWLKLVFKNYPLSNKCNKAVLDGGTYHPKACEAARAAYAAFLMGGSKAFWKYAFLVFQNQKRLRDDSWERFAGKLNLNIQEFKILMNGSPRVSQKIKEDVELGIRIGLRATPQVVFLGKRMPGNYEGEYLLSTMDHLVREKYPELKAFQLKRPRS
jgi:protein-disulfide isomerase/uncharacterized membrane protein